MPETSNTEPNDHSVSYMNFGTTDSSEDYEDNDEDENQVYEEEEDLAYESAAESSDDELGPDITSAMRLVVIAGVNSTCHLLFRFEPTTQNSTWYEKLLLDAIGQQNSWAHKVNFSHQTYHWYDREVLQVNPNGYPIRLFHIPVRLPRVKCGTVLKLCKYICTMLTISSQNTGIITCHKRNLLWMEGNVVWADVIGTTQSLSIIRSLKGTPFQGFYEQNEEFLLTYFREDNQVLTEQLFRPDTDGYSISSDNNANYDFADGAQDYF